MDETQLNRVEDGLNILIQKFRVNAAPKDASRLLATLDAKKAIRQVIMIVAINGDIKTIKPVYDSARGIGWEIVDYRGLTKRVFSQGVTTVPL